MRESIYSDQTRRWWSLFHGIGRGKAVCLNLFEFLRQEYDAPQWTLRKHSRENRKFAFYWRPERRLPETTSKDIPAWLPPTIQGRWLPPTRIGRIELRRLPERLLKFHKCRDGSRCPLREHLVEGYALCQQEQLEVNVHFTVSPELAVRCSKTLVNKKTAAYARKYGVDYNHQLLEQKPSTDTSPPIWRTNLSAIT